MTDRHWMPAEIDARVKQAEIEDVEPTLLSIIRQLRAGEAFILCEECSGMGFIEEDGRQHSCPVCDGDPKITFATVKEYARQIDELLRKVSNL